jgi:hypothetical protein
MHKDVVMSMSMTMVTMAGPAAAVPSKATNNGTPMKPVLGNVATKAPKAASFQPMRWLSVTEVMGMVAIFTYGFEISVQNFKAAGIPFYSLSNYDVLIDEAVKLNYVSDTQLVTLQDWRMNPSEWRK